MRTFFFTFSAMIDDNFWWKKFCLEFLTTIRKNLGWLITKLPAYIIYITFAKVYTYIDMYIAYKVRHTNPQLLVIESRLASLQCLPQTLHEYIWPIALYIYIYDTYGHLRYAKLYIVWIEINNFVTIYVAFLTEGIRLMQTILSARVRIPEYIFTHVKK